MKLLDRHISQAVLLAMIVVLGVVVALDVIFSLVDELGEAGVNYHAGNAVMFVLLTTPTSLYELLPYAALGGALIGLGVLASNNELVVMQSAGVHKWRIVGAVLKPTFLVMLLSLFIGEFVSPPLEQIANSNKAVQLSGSTSINSEAGTWRKIGDDYIHINAIAPGGERLIGVSRYRINEQRELESASFAESGEYVSTAAGGYWRMVNVSQSLFADRQVITSRYLQEDWQADLSPELLSVLLV